MGNTRMKARRLQVKKTDAAQSSKKVILKIPVPAKKGSIKKEGEYLTTHNILYSNHTADLPVDVEISDTSDEHNSLFDSESDDYPEVDEAKEGGEGVGDEEDELAGDVDELDEDAPVAPAPSGM
jgi:hypothetical protein